MHVYVYGCSHTTCTLLLLLWWLHHVKCSSASTYAYLCRVHKPPFEPESENRAVFCGSCLKLVCGIDRLRGVAVITVCTVSGILTAFVHHAEQPA
jgi:hypothetical protein